MNSLLSIFIYMCLIHDVAPKNIRPKAIDGAGVPFQIPQMISSSLTQLIVSTLRGLDNSEVSDTIDFPFGNFTYDYADGLAHASNISLTGFEERTSNVTIDQNTNTVKFNLYIPNARVSGIYDLIHWHYYDCGVLGCNLDVFEGNGSFHHTFYNASLQFEFKLNEEENLVRVGRTKASLHFDWCALWAENFKRDGILEYFWPQRSYQFLQNFESEFWQKVTTVALQESVNFFFNTEWGTNDKTMEDAINELLGLGATVIPEQ